VAVNGTHNLYAACMTTRTIQKGMALGLLVMILYMLGADLDSPYAWAVWSILALVLVLEHLAYWAGIAQAIELYIDLTPEQQQEIERVIKESK
jgi:hypothetical protein